MNILHIIRYTFSPKSFQEENSEEYSKTKELLSDEILRNKLMYQMEEEEKLETDSSYEADLEIIADKHWQKFNKELSLEQVQANSYSPSNAFLLLNRLAAGLLFILNPWMVYKSFQQSLNSDAPIQSSSQSFLFSTEALKNWKDLSLEVSLFLLLIPTFVFILLYFLKRKAELILALYLLTSLSICLIWGYYWVSGSDSVLPFFSSLIVALVGIVAFVFNKSFKITMVRQAHHNADEHR